MRKKAVHTIESLLARTEEEGECLLWRGFLGNGTPHVYNGEKMVSVRKLICELEGRDVTGKYFCASCGNPLCVSPKHIAQRTAQAHMKAMGRRGTTSTANTQRVISVAIARRAMSKVMTMEKANEIRADSRPCHEIAAEVGISKCMVARIKRNENWRDYSNPFLQLAQWRTV